MMNKETTGMRAYEELKNITIPQEQEEMMNIICDAWEECRNEDCQKCADRPAPWARIMACTALKFTRLLLANGYKRQSEGEFVLQEGYNHLVKCTACGYEYHDFIECMSFCGNCGAKMKGE